MAWTERRHIARGFAKRNARIRRDSGSLGEAIVWRAVVDPERLLAYRETEREYIIDPLGIEAERGSYRRERLIPPGLGITSDR
jgi:hypothetical protein